MVTPALFARYPTPADLAAADPTELEALIQSTGFFRSKAKNLIGMAKAVEERFGGKMPDRARRPRDVPGRRAQDGQRRAVGVVPTSRACPVDTHVDPACRARLGLTNETDAVKIEHDLGAHGGARRSGALSRSGSSSTAGGCATPAEPRCDVCVLAEICPSAGKVGVSVAKQAKREAEKTRGGPRRAGSADQASSWSRDPRPGRVGGARVAQRPFGREQLGWRSRSRASRRIARRSR